MFTYDAPSKQFCHTETPDTDIETAIAEMSRMIELHAALIRNELLNGTSPFEAASWPIKTSEAIKHRDTNGTVVPEILSMEAQSRGVPVENIVARVLKNAANLGALEAVISGVSGKHRDAIKELKTAQKVYSYDWRDGWPG